MASDLDDLEKLTAKIEQITKKLADLKIAESDATAKLVKNKNGLLELSYEELVHEKAVVAAANRSIEMEEDNIEALKKIQLSAEAVIKSNAKVTVTQKVFGTAIGTVTSKIEDLTTASQESGGFLSEIANKFGPKAAEGIARFTIAVGVLGPLILSTTGDMWEMKMALGGAGDSADSLGSNLLTTGMLIFNTGLSMRELTEVMKQNRVAWKKHGAVIGSSMRENSAFRAAMGLSRVEMAEFTAAAVNFSGAVDPTDLSAKTQAYVMNLKKLANLTGQQAKEIEEQRKQTEMTMTSFTGNLDQAGSKAFTTLIRDSAALVPGFKENFNAVFEGKDLNTRMQGAADSFRNMALVAMKAGVDLNNIAPNLQSDMIAAAKGSIAAGKRVLKAQLAMQEKVGKAQIDGTITYNDATREMVKGAVTNFKMVNETGKTQREQAIAAIKEDEARAAYSRTLLGQLEGSFKTVMNAIANFGGGISQGIVAFAAIGPAVIQFQAMFGGILGFLGGKLKWIASGIMSFGGILMNAGVAVFGFAKDTIGSLIGLFKDFGGMLKNAAGSVFNFAREVGGSVIKALRVFAVNLWKSIAATVAWTAKLIWSAVVGIGTFVFGLLTGSIAIVPALLALATGVWAAAAPFLPLIAIITAVVAIGYLLYKSWDSIVGVLGEVWQSFKDFLGSMGLGAIAEYFESFSNIVGGIIDFVMGLFSLDGEAMSAALGTMWTGIKGMFSAIGDMLIGAVGGIMNWILDPIKAAFNWIFGEGAWSGFGNLINDYLIQPVKNFFASIFDFEMPSIYDMITSIPGIGSLAKWILGWFGVTDEKKPDQKDPEEIRRKEKIRDEVRKQNRGAKMVTNGEVIVASTGNFVRSRGRGAPGTVATPGRTPIAGTSNLTTNNIINPTQSDIDELRKINKNLERLNKTTGQGVMVNDVTANEIKKRNRRP